MMARMMMDYGWMIFFSSYSPLLGVFVLREQNNPRIGISSLIALGQCQGRLHFVFILSHV